MGISYQTSASARRVRVHWHKQPWLPDGGRYEWWAVFMVAVPRDALAELNGANPTYEWLEKNKQKVLWSEELHFREDLPAWYSSDEAESEERVSISDGTVRLATVSEKRSRSWLAAAASGVLLLAGIAGLGFWVIRRRSRRPVAKPADPTGTGFGKMPDP